MICDKGWSHRCLPSRILSTILISLELTLASKVFSIEISLANMNSKLSYLSFINSFEFLKCLYAATFFCCLLIYAIAQGIYWNQKITPVFLWNFMTKSIYFDFQNILFWCFLELLSLLQFTPYFNRFSFALESLKVSYLSHFRNLFYEYFCYCTLNWVFVSMLSVEFDTVTLFFKIGVMNSSYSKYFWFPKLYLYPCMLQFLPMLCVNNYQWDYYL